ncbi:unnamed protein product, partial [marine sediment metagenome]
ANSNWQTDTNYVATGLAPSTQYTFRVKARDSAAAQNETAWSTEQSATTDPPDLTPPTITSTPATTATQGQLYTYDVEATGYPQPTYSLATFPAGMMINSTTGLIQWTPASTGDFDVDVVAGNGVMPDANQGFTITVSLPATDVEIIGDWATGTTHTEEPGTDRALIFIVHEESSGSTDPYVSSVTYGLQAMTKIIEDSLVPGSYGNYTAAFYLDEAGIAAASTGTFVVTWTDGTVSSDAYTSAFFENVNQTTLIGASASN